jgi:hypothetical protein
MMMDGGGVTLVVGALPVPQADSATAALVRNAKIAARPSRIAGSLTRTLESIASAARQNGHVVSLART